MGKKKIQIEKFDPAAITKAARDKIGSDESVICGIPVPSLAMQHLLNSKVLPLSRMMEIYGNPGAGKSTFLYEIMRWFVEAGGFVYLGETEQKDAAILRRAVCRWNADAVDQITASYDATFEEWTAQLSKALAHYSEIQDKQGANFPVLFSIDAVTSVESEKSVKEFADEGNIQIAYAGLALRLSKLLRSLNASYANRPFLLAFVNHVKDKINSIGYGDNKTLPGGSALYYGCHLILELTFTGSNSSAAYYTRNIQIRVEKNGIQEKGKRFIVPVRYWTTPDPLDETRTLQQILYDWDYADIKFLLDEMDSKNNSAEKRKALKAIVDLNTTKVGASNAIWSEALDIPESDPVSFSEAGNILKNTPEVFKKLQGWYINTDSVPFVAGEDYNEILEKAKQDVDARYRAISDALYKKVILDENKEEIN